MVGLLVKGRRNYENQRADQQEEAYCRIEEQGRRAEAPTCYLLCRTSL